MHSPKVYTINGLYRAYDAQICEFQQKISDEVLYLDINFGHAFEMGISDFCNFGMWWTFSLCNTGHQHLVLLPTLMARPDQWAFAFYDQMNGTGRTFASGMKNWFPSYLIYLSGWSNYRKYFEPFGDELIAHCREFYQFEAAELVKGLATQKMSQAQAYQLTEPDSPLHRYWQLHESSNREGMRELAFSQPDFNLPLKWLLENNPKDGEVCWEVLHRNLRFDLGDYWTKLLQTLAPNLKAQAKDTPFEALVQRLNGNQRDWKAAHGFYQAGQDYLSNGDQHKAFTAFENAFFLERCESGELHLQALKQLATLGQSLGGRGYRSYLSEINLPEE